LIKHPFKLGWIGLLFAVFLIFFVLKFSSPQPEVDWIHRTVNREFARFEKRGISKELVEKTWENCKQIKEFKRFKIIDSKVYGEEGKIKNLLNAIVEKYPVPDVDFIYYNEDRLKKDFFKRSKHRDAGPIFVSAKDRSLDRVILFSDWLYDIRNESEGWNYLIRCINENAARWPWEKKKEVLFWRGSPFDGKNFGKYTFQNWTTFPRGRLVLESRKWPERIDAAFSQYPNKCRFDLKRCEQEMGKCSYVPQIDQLQFKYQILIDGVTSTFPGTHWKLLSGAACFKQTSKDLLYFYEELVPWVHYIPIQNDLSDLVEKIEWAKTHDEEARKIGENGRIFAQTHLMPDQIVLYCYKVLLKYASLQKFQPSLDDYEPIPSSPSIH